MIRRKWVSLEKRTNIDFSVEQCGGELPSDDINQAIADAGLTPTAAMMEKFYQNCADEGICELVSIH